MIDAVARQYSQAGDVDGHCGFCGSRAVREVRKRRRVVHKPDCKLVVEHGGRIPLLVQEAGDG